MATATDTKSRIDPILLDSVPRSVRQRIGSIRARISRQALLLGLIRFILTLATAVVLSFALDNVLDLPRAARVIVSGAAAALLAVAFFKFVVWGWTHPADDDSIALSIESAYPELQDRLISAIQLERELRDGDAGWNSRDMIRAVIGEVESKLANLDLGRVARRERLPRLSLLTLMVVAALVVFFGTNPVLADIWFKRNVLFLEKPWPRDVEIQVIHEARTVVLGDSFTVNVEVLRGEPSRVTIDTFFADRNDRDHDMIQQGNTYRWTYQNVTESFEYQVHAKGAAPSQRFSVEVVVPPRIEDVEFYLEFPGYTQRPPTPEDDPVKHTALRVPAGTRIRYRAVANRPIEDARLVEVSPTGGRRERGETEADLVAKAFASEVGTPFDAAHPAIAADDPRVLVGELLAAIPALPAEDDGKARARPNRTRRIAFGLVADGIMTRRPTVFEVRVDPDRQPSIDVIEPGRAKDVTPAARVRITARATDDYGIVAAEIGYVIRSGETGEETEETTIVLQELAGEGERETVRDLVAGGRDIRLRTSIDVGGIGAKPGDRVIYTARARDQYPDAREAPQARTYELRVVSPEELLRILQERLLRLRSELRAIEKLQERARDLGLGVARSSAAKSALERDERKKLYESEIIERKVSTRLGLVANELDLIAEERRQNKVGDEEEARWHDELRDIARGLSENDVPEAARSLEGLRKAEALDTLVMRQTVERQDEILTAIQNLASRINRWGDYTEMIQRIRTLIGDQEEIHERTKKKVRDGHK